MEKQQIEEIQKIIEHAQAGQWIPAAIVAGLLGLIIFLLLVIYRKDMKKSDQRHEDAEKQLKALTKISAEQQLLLQKHDVKIEQLEKQV